MSISKKSFLTRHIENNHPAFLIIPFRNEDVFTNSAIAGKYSFDLKRLLEKRFPDKYITITFSGRRALTYALDQLSRNKLNKCKVRIQTTSDNFYISSCVTNVIEEKNQWHRSKDENWDFLLINHEFGYADNRILNEIKLSSVIEDCAFAFDSKLTNGKRCGQVAPYSVFSFSKFFPIQLGGCLISDQYIETHEDESVTRYIENIVGYYFNKIPEWSEKRLKAFNYYNKVFGQLGCKPTFNGSNQDIPGVYLFDLPKTIDAQKLKKYYWARGIQCSVFYGRQAFYLPLNQFTLHSHIEYFADIFKSFQLQEHE